MIEHTINRADLALLGKMAKELMSIAEVAGLPPEKDHLWDWLCYCRNARAKCLEILTDLYDDDSRFGIFLWERFQDDMRDYEEGDAFSRAIRSLIGGIYLRYNDEYRSKTKTVRISEIYLPNLFIAFQHHSRIFSEGNVVREIEIKQIAGAWPKEKIEIIRAIRDRAAKNKIESADLINWRLLMASHPLIKTMKAKEIDEYFAKNYEKMK